VNNEFLGASGASLLTNSSAKTKQFRVAWPFGTVSESDRSYVPLLLEKLALDSLASQPLFAL
jgi:hypothetical protein